MKHVFVFLFLAFFIILNASSQPKFELGLSTEGSWVMKKELTVPGGHIGERHNWGTAFGAYIFVPVWWRFSLSGGVGCRYSEIQKGDAIWTPHENRPGAYLSGYDYRKFQRYYMVVPFNLNLLVTRNVFITGGIEYCRVLNDYTSILKNPEYNWTIGIGSQKHKLRWSLQYLRGFNEQRIQNKASADGSDPGFLFYYQTNRLQLNLSYPLLKSR